MFSYNRFDKRDAEGDQLEPMNTQFVGNLNYPQMKGLAIKLFSSFLVFLGITSILVQVISILMLEAVVDIVFLDNSDSSVSFSAMFGFFTHGIWGGVAYLMVGSLGIAAALQRKKSLLVATIVMSTLVIFISLMAALLPELAGGTELYFNYECHGKFGKPCDAWAGFQLALLIFHLLAFICSIVLNILTSMVICSCCADSHTLISNYHKFETNNDQASLL